MNEPRRRWIPFRVALLLVASAAVRIGAQEAVPLAPRFDPETKWSVHALTRFELDLTTVDTDGKKSSYSQIKSREDTYSREFAEVRDGFPTRQTVMWLVSRESVSHDMTQKPAVTILELEGRTFQVTSQGDGQSVTCLNGTVGDKTLQQVQPREQCLALLPSKPIAVGDSWNVEGADACRFLVGAYAVIPDQESSISCTLKDLRSEGAGSIAVIGISIAVKGRSTAETGGAGYDLVLSMAGDMTFDVTKGMPRTVTLDGTLKLNGVKTGQVGETLLRVEGSGAIKLDLEFH